MVRERAKLHKTEKNNQITELNWKILRIQQVNK